MGTLLHKQWTFLQNSFLNISLLQQNKGNLFQKTGKKILEIKKVSCDGIIDTE
jgi:hypothetical protein